MGYKLKAALKTTLVPEVGPRPVSFTRPLPVYERDFEGRLVLVPANCARFGGARFVQNIANTSITNTDSIAGALSSVNGLGTVNGSAATITMPQEQAVGPDGASMLVTRGTLALNGGTTTNDRAWVDLRGLANSPISSNGRFGRSSIWARAVSGSPTVQYRFGNNVIAIALTQAWRRISVQNTLSNGDGTHIIGLRGSQTDGAADIQVCRLLLEEITGQSNTNPSEYVPRGTGLAWPYMGAGVDGCQWFEWENGNTVDASGLVTEARGPAIPDATLKRLRTQAAGAALHFAGNNTGTNQFVRVNVGAGNPLDIADDVSIEAWILPDVNGASTTGHILRCGLGFDERYGFSYNAPARALAFGYYDGAFRGSSSSAGVVTNGQWNHVVVTRIANVVTFYVNGVAVGGGGPVNTPTGPAAQLSVGATLSNIQQFEGTIDEPRVYARGLSAAEIAQHYAGTYTNETGLALHWDFNEAAGTVANDTSGNGNHGTIINAPIWLGSDVGTATSVADKLEFDKALINNAQGTAYARVTPLSSSGGQRILGDTSGGAQSPLLYSFGGSGAGIHDGTTQQNGPAGAPAATVVAASTWSAASGTMRAYADGVPGAAAAYDGAIAPNGNVGIGFGQAGFGFQGYIGDVVILDTALSEFDVPSLPDYQFPTIVAGPTGRVVTPAIAAAVPAPQIVGAVPPSPSITGVA